MTAEDRAQALATRRAELLARLPRKIPAARSLNEVDRELVVDEAIDYAVLGNTLPVERASDLERVFWTAADFRVKNAVAGRGQTVRGRFTRAPADALDDIADDSDPATAVEHAEEIRLVREFAETLADRERRVLRVKYFSGTIEPLGYKRIAQHLGITQASARAADRAIRRALEQFAAVYTAGQLCPTREFEIAALAAGTADRRQARLARAHVAHCQHCHATYAEQLRAIRSAAFERKVASVLPVVEVQERGRVRGAWDAVADWIARPFGHDTAATAAQLAASGAGRGAGTIAMLKIAGVCMASATAVGVCATTFVGPVFTGGPPAKTEPRKPDKRKAEGPVGRHARIPTRADQQLTPTPTATPKEAKRRGQPASSDAAGRTQGGTGPTDHETTPASPAPSNAAPGGESEFDPTYQPSEQPAPAPVPAAAGSGEFF
jgi:hypothetical protein